MDTSSGVGVLDKAALVLTALEQGPTTLAGLVTATGLARPTAHRLAVALEHHRLVNRDLQGRFVLGPRLARLAIVEGRYHQVKRMFGYFQNKVVSLHRESMGGIHLDPTLAPGEFRPLTADEIAL